MSAAQEPPWQRATAVAIALPSFALALPFTLAGDLQAELTGAGWALMLSVPLLLTLVLRRAAPAPRGLLLLLGFGAAALASVLAFPPADTLESDRALALLLASAITFLGGASLGAVGRAWLLRAAILISLVVSVGALSAGPPFAGPLQNTGASSELALPGALAGAWVFARDRADGARAVWRWLGLAALLAEVAFAARAPVFAAAVACVALLPLGALFAARGDRRRMLVATGLALAAMAVGWTLRTGAGTDGPGPTVGAEAPAGAAGAAGPQVRPTELDLGGVEVRRRVWGTLPRLALDHPLLGVGPGQFAAAYPPYRDPAERQLSDRFLGERAQSEVEHAHNDWLQGPLEVGLIGGALWLLLLALTALRAAAGLRGDALNAALGAAALAVLVNALLRAPLLYNPGAAPLAFALFGAVLAREGSRRLGRWTVFLLLIGTGLHLGQARAIARHGRLLGSWPGCLESYPAALEARPDSVAALSLAARAAEAVGPRAAIDGWEAVLELRPHRREALIQAGNALARAGELERAERRWRYALALDPADPLILGNLMRAAAFAGDVEAALEWHARAGFEDDRLALVAFALLQEQADVERARALLDHAEPRYRDLSAARAHDLAGELEAEAESSGGAQLRARARVLRGYAQLIWARQHAAQGDPGSAVRSYRQALAGLSSTRADGTDAAPERVRYELAAALALDGRAELARAELRAITDGAHDARILRALPPWAGEAILPLLLEPD